MPPPVHPKIYHILHVDRLASVIQEQYLWSDATLVANPKPGTTIGMSAIKARRLNELQLASHPGLFVGQCVPFYFCARSVMLYLIWRGNNPDLAYVGGQGPIVHLEADLHAAVAWANGMNRRWAFSLSNAGSRHFEDRGDLAQLNEINWEAVATNRWAGSGISADIKEEKQAEFLVEESFPWHLVERIGVHSQAVAQQVAVLLQGAVHRPPIHILTGWYYP